jgi:cardiolipin synthase
MNNKEVDREITYIPLRYIIAMMLVVFEICAIIATVVALCYFVPYFYLLAYVTQIVCVMKLIVSDDNPDYKIPWLLFVLILPIAGFMLYLMFYSRVLKKKYVKRLVELNDKSYKKDDSETMSRLCEENEVAGAQAKMLCNIARTHVFENTKQEYYPSGELLFENMIKDLKTAEKFILMEYFIIEDGKLWREILEVLKEKAKNGVEIKIVYDDIGCMKTLPGNYYKTLRKMGIDAVPFSYLKGNADNEINNRSHRKITVIDGKIGYTGGANIAPPVLQYIRLFFFIYDAYDSATNTM